MKGAGTRFVRIGEFAWTTLEPRKRRYEFECRPGGGAAPDRGGDRHPTAAPPALLTTRYPEVLRTISDGCRVAHGGRHQASYTSATFNRLARSLVAALADHSGHDRDVIGWQIDNEIGGVGPFDECGQESVG